MAVMLSVGFSACGDDEIAPSNGGGSGNGEPSLQEQVASTSVTGGVYDISATSATFIGYVNLTPTELATATFGIIWGTEEDLKWDSKAGYATSRDLETNKYSVTTHDLVPERKYFYRSYVCLKGNTYLYGAVKSFTTQTVQIEIQTGEASNVSQTSATLSASVQNFSSELPVNYLSIIWGTNEDLSWENKLSYANYSKLDDGKFSVTATGLSQETTYYYRAYCNVRGKYVYGDVKSFTTLRPEKMSYALPYALWCKSNSTLYFTYSDDALKVGYTYDNEIITSLWKGNYIVAQSTDNPAWESILRNVTHVVFEESFKEIKPKNLSHWFSSTKILSSMDGLEYLNTSEATDMSSMFGACSSLTSLDVSHFDTKNVTNMRSMFSGCSSLTSLDVSHFDTQNVTDMQGMFYGCSSLTSLDVSHFDTKNVTDMWRMFFGCIKLTSLDVSNFDTQNVTYMGWMFQGCSNLTTIYCNDTWSCRTSYDMFGGCISLVGAIAYDSSKTDVKYANPDTGYFTRK